MFDSRSCLSLASHCIFSSFYILALWERTEVRATPLQFLFPSPFPLPKGEGKNTAIKRVAKFKLSASVSRNGHIRLINDSAYGHRARVEVFGARCCLDHAMVARRRIGLKVRNEAPRSKAPRYLCEILRPSSAVADFGRRRPKRTLLAYSAEAVASAAKAGRQGYGGYPPRIHPRVYTRGFLRRRVSSAPRHRSP